MKRLLSWFWDTRLGFWLRPAYVQMGNRRYRILWMRGVNICVAGDLEHPGASEMVSIVRSS